MPGLYFDEFHEGQTFDHAFTRTVTDHDNIQFSLMTLNPQPIHVDHHFSAGTEFGKPVFNSLYTLGIMIGMSVYDTTLGTTVGNLGMTDVVFPAPVFAGDTLRSRTKVVSTRASKSRPGQGIVEFEHEALNQDGVVVAKCRRQALMKGRPDPDAG